MNTLFGLTVQDWVTLIAALTAATASILGAIKGFKNADKLVEVHKDLDGRLTELVAESKRASHAEGKEEGRKETETGLSGIH